MNKKLIYTVLLGGYDDLKEPREVTPGWDYVVFTDNRELKSDNWFVSWGGYYNTCPETDIKKQSRWFKLKPLGGYDTTLYVDASYRPLGNLDEFIEGKTEGVWMTRHPQRNCVYREAQTVREKGLDNENTVLEQVGRYRDEGLPDRGGLWRGGVIVRNKGCEAFNEKWWEEVSRGTYRDQISAPYAARATGTKIHDIPHGQVEQYFAPSLHKPHKVGGGVVRVSDPAEISTYKDCWICLGDFPKAEQAIEEFPEVHLITNQSGALLFPRWLYNYLQFPEQMIKHVQIYGGSYVLYFK